MNQHDNTQVVLIQVPNSQNGSQMVMAHISNSQLQSANVPVTVTEVPSDPDPDGETEDGKKPRRTKGRGRTKQVKPDTSNTPLRPLAPRMFAVPISSPVLIAGPSGNSQVTMTLRYFFEYLVSFDISGSVLGLVLVLHYY